MEKSLNEIARDLRDGKRVQLIYAFNGIGKTRLSKEFEKLIVSENDLEEVNGLAGRHVLYYNAFTEDLFYWDNGTSPKLKIQPNFFTKWIFEDQGQEINISKNFQRYTKEKLTPRLNEPRTLKTEEGKEIIVDAFTEVSFSYERGNEERSDNIKISKGEESCFIWSIFYSLLDQIIEVLNIDKDSIEQERETDAFDNLEYVFIDDPVTSLDENHLIEMAVDLADIIKKSISELKFVITTHNPLFYNVLANELKNKNKETGYNPNKYFDKYCLIKTENLMYALEKSNDSPFAYHLFLLNEVKKAVDSGKIYKYHFNFLRNILEKTSTFLGYDKWGDLLEIFEEGDKDLYINRILNLSSHSKHSAEEVAMITDNDKRVLAKLVEDILEVYKFNIK